MFLLALFRRKNILCNLLIKKFHSFKLLSIKLMDKNKIIDSTRTTESKESFEIKFILSCCGWTYESV